MSWSLAKWNRDFSAAIIWAAGRYMDLLIVILMMMVDGVDDDDGDDGYDNDYDGT